MENLLETKLENLPKTKLEWKDLFGIDFGIVPELSSGWTIYGLYDSLEVPSEKDWAFFRELLINLSNLVGWSILYNFYLSITCKVGQSTGSRIG